MNICQSNQVTTLYNLLTALLADSVESNDVCVMLTHHCHVRTTVVMFCVYTGSNTSAIGAFVFVFIGVVFGCTP